MIPAAVAKSANDRVTLHLARFGPTRRSMEHAIGRVGRCDRRTQHSANLRQWKESRRISGGFEIRFATT